MIFFKKEFKNYRRVKNNVHKRVKFCFFEYKKNSTNFVPFNIATAKIFFYYNLQKKREKTYTFVTNNTSYQLTNRVDFFLYKIGSFQSFLITRKFIKDNNVVVNDVLVNYPKFLLIPGDVVSFKKNSIQNLPVFNVTKGPLETNFFIESSFELSYSINAFCFCYFLLEKCFAFLKKRNRTWSVHCNFIMKVIF